MRGQTQQRGGRNGLDGLARWFSLQQAFGPQQDLATLQALFSLDSAAGMGMGGMDMGMPGMPGMQGAGAPSGLSPEEAAVIQGIQQQMQSRGY